MVVCDECDAENRDDAQFCASCGAKLVRPEPFPADKDNPFGLPDFGGNPPLSFTPTKVIPRRVREKLTESILRGLLLPLFIAVVLLCLLIHALLSN
jgi:hypothetical protein